MYLVRHNHNSAEHSDAALIFRVYIYHSFQTKTRQGKRGEFHNMPDVPTMPAHGGQMKNVLEACRLSDEISTGK